MPGAYRGMCQVGGLEANLVQGTDDFQSWARGCTSNRSGSGNTLAVIPRLRWLPPLELGRAQHERRELLDIRILRDLVVRGDPRDLGAA